MIGPCSSNLDESTFEYSGTLMIMKTENYDQNVDYYSASPTVSNLFIECLIVFLLASSPRAHSAGQPIIASCNMALSGRVTAPL